MNERYLLAVSGCANAAQCLGRVSTPFPDVTTMSLVAVAGNTGVGRLSDSCNNLLARLRRRCRAAPWHRPLTLRPQHEPLDGMDIVLHIGGQVSTGTCAATV